MVSGPTVSAPRTADAVPTLRQVARSFPAWLRSHAVAALTSVVAGAAFSYAWNVWLIAMMYRGAHRVPVGAPATGSRNLVYGGLFWALCGMLIFGVANYWHAVGTRRFFAELQGLPHKLANLIRRDHAAGVHLLWGAAVAMLLAVVLSPSVGLVVAIGLVIVAAGSIGSILSAFLARAWSRLTTRFSPTKRGTIAGITGVAVGLIGAAGALVAAFLITNTGIKLIVVAALAALALALGRKIGPPSTGVTLAAIGTLLVLSWLTNPAHALADAVGSPDCPCTAGLSCMADPTTLSGSIVGGIAGGLGALAGAALAGLANAASALGGGSGPSGPGAPLSSVPMSGPDTSQPTDRQGHAEPTLVGTPAPAQDPAAGADPLAGPAAWLPMTPAAPQRREWIPLGGPAQGARVLQLLNQLEQSKATSRAQAADARGYDNIADFLHGFSMVMDLAANTFTCFVGPYGLLANAAYSTVKDAAYGWTSGRQSALQIVGHASTDVWLDIAFAFPTASFPSWERAIAKEVAQAFGLGLANVWASDTLGNRMGKHPTK
jgi:hypothetical protein